jgi:hypothetical protein
MSSATTTYKAQKVREISASAFTDSIESLALIEILEAANGNGIHVEINKAGAGFAANEVKMSLFTRIHILISRAYSKNSRERDLNAEQAMNLLKEESVFEEVQNGKHSRGLLEEAMEMWNRNRGNHLYQRFMEFRDTQLVHFSERNPDIPTPLVKDIFDFTRLTTTALERLANGTGVVGLTLESQIPGHRKSAELFWKPWQAKSGA